MMSKNTYVASVRVSMLDMVGIGRFLMAQGVKIESKGQILSAGIKFLGHNIPDDFKCNSYLEALDELIKMNLGSGLDKNNRLAKNFRRAIEDEKNCSDFALDAERIIADQKNDCIQMNPHKIDYNKLPKDFLGQSVGTKSSESIKSVVTAHEGYEADIPGNKTDFKKEMLSGINSIKPYDERENDE